MSQEIPSATNRGLTFFPVPEFSDGELAFGAPASRYFAKSDHPPVPGEHTSRAMDLFVSGGALPDLDPRVDRALAARAVSAWLSSFAPSHESKEATVGYAFWVWSTPEAIDAA